MPVTTLLEPLWVSAVASFEPFGALGLICGLAAGLMPRRGLILAVSAACSAFFCAHYLRLGSPTGTAMCLISVAQSLAAARLRPGAAQPGWLLAFFGATSLLAAGLIAATWTGWPSACAGAGALLATAARLQTKAQALRLLLVACTICWVGHNALVGSVFGLTCDALTILSLTLGLWRYRTAPVPTPRPVLA